MDRDTPKRRYPAGIRTHRRHVTNYANNKIILMTHRMNYKNKFSEGMVISTKAEPALRLIINTCADSVYYCIRVGDRTGKELSYLAEELQLLEQRNAPIKPKT